jgi:hypothetical protein
MIGVFGIEPEVMAQWEHFKSLYPAFGVSKRRLIGRYPKKWKAMVCDRARELVQLGKNTEMQTHRMVERLANDDSRFKFYRVPVSDYTPEKSWFDNAMGHQPTFEAIVADSCPYNDGRACPAEDLLIDEAPFHKPAEITIPRTAEAIIGTAECLLKAACQVVLVEPNFNAAEPRFVKTVMRLIEMLENNASPPKKIELHTVQPEGGMKVDIQKRNYSRTFEPYLPKGWNLDICFWGETSPADYLHPRFIMTEHGAIQIDYGLDEGEVGSTTIAKGVDDDLFAQLFVQYSSEGTRFSDNASNVRIRITG